MSGRERRRRKEREMSERSSLKDKENERPDSPAPDTEEETDPCEDCAGGPWNFEDCSRSPVHRTAANSTITILTFAAFIGFAYLVWIGIQALGKGLASLDWDAFREALEDLKRWIRYPTSLEESRDDQNDRGEDGHQKDNPHQVKP